MANPLKVILNKFFPTQLKTQGSNITEQSFDPDLTHSVSLLSGWDGNNENIAVVDAAGNLHVNLAGSSFLNYQVISITAPTAQPASANVIFNNNVSEIDLIISNNAINVQLVNSINGAVGGTIPLPTGSTNIKYVTNSMLVWSQSTASAASVTVIGWW